jgi:transcriptional regulator with XRE-family HTH domain
MPTDSRSAELIALGNAIRRRRLAQELTLTQLASEAQVSRVMLVGIEGGRRNPGIRSIFKIADALGVRPHELVLDAEVDPAD